MSQKPKYHFENRMRERANKTMNMVCSVVLVALIFWSCMAFIYVGTVWVRSMP